MNSMVNKLKHWVTGDPFDEEYYPMDEAYETEPDAYSRTAESDMDPLGSKKAKRKLKVLEHPSSQSTQVVVVEPRAFEDALEMIDHLRVKKSVILNLHLLDTAQSQRVVDFLSGATHALDGHQQRIGDGVFIFTPSNVVIRSEVERSTGMPTGAGLSDAFWNHGR
jgi:cell division inhibitor SepF